MKSLQRLVQPIINSISSPSRRRRQISSLTTESLEPRELKTLHSPVYYDFTLPANPPTPQVAEVGNQILINIHNMQPTTQVYILIDGELQESGPGPWVFEVEDDYQVVVLTPHMTGNIITYSDGTMGPN